MKKHVLGTLLSIIFSNIAVAGFVKSFSPSSNSAITPTGSYSLNFYIAPSMNLPAFLIYTMDITDSSGLTNHFEKSGTLMKGEPLGVSNMPIGPGFYKGFRLIYQFQNGACVIDRPNLTSGTENYVIYQKDGRIYCNPQTI